MNLPLVTKYMTFRLMEQKAKTVVLEVVNNTGDYSLGFIEWYGPWRQYVFQPASNTEFNAGCLSTITAVLNQLKQEQTK